VERNQQQPINPDAPTSDTREKAVLEYAFAGTAVGQPKDDTGRQPRQDREVEFGKGGRQQGSGEKGSKEPEMIFLKRHVSSVKIRRSFSPGQFISGRIGDRRRVSIKRHSLPYNP
jgi:hypothetical protein